jgi:phosphotransferase system  glucose/maltose/N-acetylglucosamine-specific IIC component
MDQNKIFNIIIAVLVAATLIIGVAIAAGIFTTKWTKELIQISLERGQNPMYVKCAMESNPSNECKTLITALAVARSDK